MLFIGQTPEDHFNKSVELELELESKGKHELLAEVRAISDMVNIHNRIISCGFHNKI